MTRHPESKRTPGCITRSAQLDGIKYCLHEGRTFNRNDSKKLPYVMNQVELFFFFWLTVKSVNDFEAMSFSDGKLIRIVVLAHQTIFDIVALTFVRTLWNEYIIIT